MLELYTTLSSGGFKARTVDDEKASKVRKRDRLGDLAQRRKTEKFSPVVND